MKVEDYIIAVFIILFCIHFIYAYYLLTLTIESYINLDLPTLTNNTLSNNNFTNN